MKGGQSMKKSLLLGSLVFISVAQAAVPGYHVIKTLPIGGTDRWDYLTVDNAARRLYVSHGSHVAVVDLKTDAVVGDIPNTLGVHGIALAPGLNRGFISCGKANKAIIFDLKTLDVLGQMETGENPDAILYDPATRRVFTFNGKSNDATVFDAASGEVAGTIALGGKPEFARTDGKGKVYVNIETLNEVVEIDSQKLVVARRFSIQPGEGPTGMGFDVEHHRIFSGCGNKIMTVLDTETGKVIATVPIGDGCDGVGFDPATGLAFGSNGGDGTLTVVRETSPGKFGVAETIPTEVGARTMELDPETHNIYLSYARFSPPAEPTPEVPKPRKQMVKDSFGVLVVGK
jgi:DNA-binding beta-propeller fold protein YncE